MNASHFLSVFRSSMLYGLRVFILSRPQVNISFLFLASAFDIYPEELYRDGIIFLKNTPPLNLEYWPTYLEAYRPRNNTKYTHDSNIQHFCEVWYSVIILWVTVRELDLKVKIRNEHFSNFRRFFRFVFFEWNFPQKWRKLEILLSFMKNSSKILLMNDNKVANFGHFWVKFHSKNTNKKNRQKFEEFSFLILTPFRSLPLHFRWRSRSDL